MHSSAHIRQLTLFLLLMAAGNAVCGSAAAQAVPAPAGANQTTSTSQPPPKQTGPTNYNLLGYGNQYDSNAPAWVFVPRVGLVETGTDNVSDTVSNRKSDLLSILSLRASLSGDTPRISLVANYAASAAAYLDDRNQDHISQTFYGTGRAIILRDLAFLDFHASADDNRRDFGGLSGPAALTKSNSVQTYTVSASPYMTLPLEHIGDLELRYSSSFDWFQGNTGAIGPNLAPISNENQQQAKAEFTLPGTVLRRLLTDVFASGQYTQSPHGIGIFRRDIAEAINEYQITRSFSILGAGGYEKFSDHLYPRATGEGVVWTGGIRWRPNADSSVLLTYGRYDLATDFGGEIQFRITPFTLLYAAYTDSIGSTQQQISSATGNSTVLAQSSFANQILNDQPIAGVTFDENPVIATANKAFLQQLDDISNLAAEPDLNLATGLPLLDLNSFYPIQNSLYRQKSLRSIIYRNIGGSTISVELFHNDRTTLNTPIPISQQSNGAQARFGEGISSYITLNVSGSFQRLQNPGGGWSNLEQGNLGFIYDFAETARATISYNYTRHDILGASGIATQNTLSVGIGMSF